MIFTIWIALAVLTVIAAPFIWTLWQEQKLLNERLGNLKKRLSAADMRYAGLWDYTQKLGDVAKELSEKCDGLEEQIKDLPLDQIQSVYDSEKQFQDGLSAIMNYGLQSFGLNKEQGKND